MIQEKSLMSTEGTYMLDTNVFDRVLCGKVPLSSFGGHRVLVTGIQRDELNKTPDPAKRAALLATFEAVNPDVVPASSFAFDIEGAGFDQALWNDGSGKFEKMRARLEQLDSKTKKPLNQERDILIAETAIKNRATFVSDDHNLRRVVSEFGGSAIDTTKVIP
jgi:hypothetical protein